MNIIKNDHTPKFFPEKCRFRQRPFTTVYSQNFANIWSCESFFHEDSSFKEYLCFILQVIQEKDIAVKGYYILLNYQPVKFHASATKCLCSKMLKCYF